MIFLVSIQCDWHPVAHSQYRSNIGLVEYYSLKACYHNLPSSRFIGREWLTPFLLLFLWKPQSFNIHAFMKHKLGSVVTQWDFLCRMERKRHSSLSANFATIQTLSIILCSDHNYTNHSSPVKLFINKEWREMRTYRVGYSVSPSLFKMWSFRWHIEFCKSNSGSFKMRMELVRGTKGELKLSSFCWFSANYSFSHRHERYVDPLCAAELILQI